MLFFRVVIQCISFANEEKKVTIENICSKFSLKGKYKSHKQLTVGNVNVTYRVDFSDGAEENRYTLQKINKSVFTEPEKLMDNILRVTAFIRENIKKQKLPEDKFVLGVIAANDGKPYVVDDCGEYWRCYGFIKNSVTFDSAVDLNIIKRAGQAFGRFQNCLSGFDANSLFVTLKDFHNTAKRYDALKSAVEADPFKRAEKVKKETEILLSFEKKAVMLQEYLDSGEIPFRVTHNDTKCNNVSFDGDTGEPLAVLDLDTVMPGAVAHDFGDAVRFIANSALEDDPDIKKVSLDLSKYKAFAKGFIGEVKGSLTETEKRTMNLGVIGMTAELAARFLTDYISGDVYFKTNYPEHNLVRTRNQIALLADADKKFGEMERILSDVLAE